MSAAQEKLDALKITLDNLVGKVGELSTAFHDLLASMTEAKDDPEELAALITKGEAMISTIDAALAEAAPVPPTPAP